MPKLTDEQLAERQKNYDAGQAAIAEAKNTVPDWESKLMKFRLKNTGEILLAGWQIGFAALQRGDAELVKG
jgi:hypothetical protein